MNDLPPELAPPAGEDHASAEDYAAGVAVIIPAYNEAATIRALVMGVLSAVPRLGWLIVIDDGSRDATTGQLEGLGVTLLRHSRNRGKGASLLEGMRWALEQGAHALVTLDADGQHRPEDIPQLLGQARHHPKHIIIGARLHDRAQFPARRYYANRCASIGVSWATGYKVADSQSGFRVYPAALFHRVRLDNLHQTGFAFESEVLVAAASHGVQSIAVPIPGIYPKQARASHFRPLEDTLRIAFMLLGYIARRHLCGRWGRFNAKG